MTTVIQLIYLVATALFIFALHWMNDPKTARKGVFSGVLGMTLAIIGTPVVLLLARKHEMRPTMLLLALCIAVTTGSVLSPIGNPQNLLIALHGGIVNPFVTVFRWLFVPTVANLLLAFWFLRRFYPDDFHAAELKHSQEPIHDHQLAMLSRLSLQMIVALVALKVVGVVFGWTFELPLTVIALASALPVLPSPDAMPDARVSMARRNSASKARRVATSPRATSVERL